MGDTVAPWNLVQLAFVAVYPAYLSYIRMVDGMSLLALYVFLFILCIPPMFIQLKLGGHEHRGLVGILSRYLPIFKGIGVALLIDLFLTCVFLGPLVCHFGMYVVISVIQKPYIWARCDNSWNTNLCKNHDITNGGVISDIAVDSEPSGILKSVTPEIEFFHGAYLQLSPNIDQLEGFPIWNNTFEMFEGVNIPLLPIALACLWILVFFFIGFGPRVCGWILFILGPSFLVIILVVLGYGYSQLDREHANSYLQRFYSLDFSGFVQITNNKKLISDWIEGFHLLMNSFPVWTAIPVTLGKLTGRGKVSRNIGWLIVIIVYALVVQVPQLAMAPYLGNLMEKTKGTLHESTFTGLSLIFEAMPAAFAVLEIPPAFAALFFLSLFISGLMFLCIAMMTIVDNIVESLTSCISGLADRKICTNFVTSFILICLVCGLGIIHTTRAGMYYIAFMDQSVLRLRFITVSLLAISIIIVYVKQKFAISERIIMSIWCLCAAICATGFWMYSFITTVNEILGYNDVKIPDTWNLISWLLSGLPYIAIPAAAIHACMLHDGSCQERTEYLLCGGDEDSDRDRTGYMHPPEPTAPPYYMDGPGYMDSMYPLEDLHKAQYDSDTEPLNTSLRQSRI